MCGGDYGPAILTGKSTDSKLIKRLVSGDGGLQMPPTGALSDEEIGLLRAWIDQGADFRLEVKPEAPPKPVDPKLLTLFRAIRAGQSVDVDAKLIRAVDAAGSTALHYAAAHGTVEMMERLLNHGADPNAANRTKTTPLAWALDSEAKVSLLLAKGAAVDARQIDGRTALYQAASIGRGAEIVKLLLDKGANPNAALVNGRTPLMAAASQGNVAVMKLLLAKRADVNARSGTGATALMATTSSGVPAAVALL